MINVVGVIVVVVVIGFVVVAVLIDVRVEFVAAPLSLWKLL